jgi:putative endonuclease
MSAVPDRMNRRRAAHRRGHAAERLAALRLTLAGYRILARRYRTRVGEIDLVARRGGVLAFVEVKQRREIGAAMDAVTPQSRARIRRTAELFLKNHPALCDLTCRFDVVVVIPWRWPRHLVDAWRED